nr:receptor-like protein 12 [Quercus suber]
MLNMGRFSFIVFLALVDFFLECSHFCWSASATSTIGCIEAERLALQDFKDSLTGNLNRLYSWTGQDCCNWEGVSCNNSTGHVIKLDLRNLVYPDSFGYVIEASNRLDLTNNLISGWIPEDIGNMTPTLDNLLLSDFSANNLSGFIPTSFGNATSLQSLHLSNNSLQGELPLSLRNCTGMVIFDVGENKLSGSAPRWIGESMLRLEILRLRSNMFDGIIPLEICQLAELQVLDLAHNNLSGIIPRCFGNLKECVSPEPPQAYNEGKDEGNGPEIEWLYIFMSAGYVTGLWGVLGVMMYKKNWRDAYFKFVDDIKEKTISRFKEKVTTPNRRSRTRSNHTEWSW